MLAIFHRKMLHADMSIDLGRRQVLMAQELLHAPKVCPVVEHGGGEAMAEFMGVGTSRQACFLKNLLDARFYSPCGLELKGERWS